MAKLDAHSGETLSAADQRQLTALRGALTGGFDSLLKLLYAPHVTVGWLEGRLAVMRVTARSLARFLTPAELARLRASIIRLEVVVRDKSLRASLASIAVALATPAAPAAPPVAAATGEIVLQADRGGYSVSGRINDAMTLKFVLDSGAAVVALPSDVVEALTKSGAIQPVDILGHAIYITADGKHHKGTTLMLRQLDVGGHVVTNVRAAVGPASTTPLLGQSFLTKFKSWTLDNQRHMLIITE